jgi:VWFA-related protein
MHFLCRGAWWAAAGSRFALVGLSIISVALVRAPGQAAAAGAAQNQTITLTVTVADKMGQPIRGLQESDFTVLDNKQPQKLLSFRAVDPKADPSKAPQAVIVLDMINTGFGVVSREREELGEFLKENGGKLPAPVSLATLAESGLKVAKGSTRDGNALQEAMKQQGSELRAVGRDAGFWGAAERFQMSLTQLGQLAEYEASMPGRKMVLFISPGWPLLPSAGEQSGLKARNSVFDRVVQLTNGLREANIALYTIDPYELGRTDPFLYEGYLKGVAMGGDAQYPDLSLQVLSIHSGGQVLVSGRDVKGELERSMLDAGVRYEMSFAAASGDRVNEYHALQVTVNKPGAVVRTSSGYYAHTVVAH